MRGKGNFQISKMQPFSTISWFLGIYYVEKRISQTFYCVRYLPG